MRLYFGHHLTESGFHWLLVVEIYHWKKAIFCFQILIKMQKINVLVVIITYRCNMTKIHQWA